jgi:dienelactone hydrolase
MRPTRRTLGALAAGLGLAAPAGAAASTGGAPRFRLGAPDTLAERWARLEPHVTVYGPDDDQPRPAVMLFHGCGGQRSLARHYAEAAAAIGWRAFTVDSFAARGWNRPFALTFVCTGMLLKGSERAGDVLATCWGVTQRPDVDPDKLVIAGWSHGSWSAMDLMTMPLTRPGEAGLADPSPEPLTGLRGLFLAYPYGGIGALSRVRDWVRKTKVAAILCEKDHITSPKDAERLYGAARRAGCEVELWRVGASHAFDEEDCGPPMKYDPELSAQSHARFQRFLEATLKPEELAPEALSA